MSAELLRLLVLAAIALAAIAGALRAWRHARRFRIALVALNIFAAVLLALVLMPPARDPEPGTLIVLTGGASGAQLAALPLDADVVALPEVADPPAQALRVADLRAALRARADRPRLRVLGDGLAARDRDAVDGHALRFEPPAFDAPLQSLWSPPSVGVGARFDVIGRVAVGRAQRVQLRDPGGAIATTARVLRDGRFVLTASTRAAGDVTYTLRLLDARDAVVLDVALPIAVVDAPAPRVLFLAGAPSPDLKYLRRWARDAGIDAGVRIALAPGITIDREPPRLDAATLAQADLVVLDERAWAALAANEKAALVAALDDGLGVLLRLTAEPGDALLREWRTLGLALAREEIARTVTLRGEVGVLPKEIALWRLPLRADGGDATPLLRADDAHAPGVVLARGRGRLAALWLTDSYRLVLEGHADRYGSLWSRVVARVGRARATWTPRLPERAWRYERATICGVGADTVLVDPAGDAHALAADRSSGDAHCAAIWPALAGWHTLRDGERTVDFAVEDPARAPALHRLETRAATRALVRETAATTADAIAPARVASLERAIAPAARWPWFVAWLLVMAASWWLERRARAASPGPSAAAR